MGKKFDAIFESVISRSECGGFLPGDIIKFRDGYKNTETYKFMPSTLKKEVDELATCGLNIKVCQVGDKKSGYSIGNQFKPASQIVLTIAADHGGGRTYGRVVVCPDMVDMVDVSAGVPVPDQFKRKDTVIIKPKQLKIDPKIITNVTDKGNGKNTPTDLKLAGESRINKNGVLSESVPSMSITVTKAFDPLTKSSGFSAKDKLTLDSAFAFSEKDAIDKLIKRNNPSHAVVQLSNGSIRTYGGNKSRSIGESKSWDYTKEIADIYDTMLCESMNANMDDPKDLILHIRHARKMGDYQKVKSLTNRLRTIAMRMDMLDDPDILDIIGDEEEDNEEDGDEEQDACYEKVKSRYDVWPSAYASGALVQCRKVGAKNWGNSEK